MNAPRPPMERETSKKPCGGKNCPSGKGPLQDRTASQCARVVDVTATRGTEGPEMNATTYGLDIAKHVFQLYWLDPETGEIHNQRFQRQKLIEFLAKREPGRV